MGINIFVLYSKLSTAVCVTPSQSQRHWSVKYSSISLGHSACLKSMPRTVTMQGFTVTAISGEEKHTLMLIVDRQTNFSKLLESKL